MEIMENPDDLQKAANYRSLRKILRPAGIGSIVFGLIAILAGAPGMNKNIIDAALALIGLFLFLAAGFWVHARYPSAPPQPAHNPVFIRLGSQGK